MPETWFILKSGDFADPSEVAPDEKGVLRHKSGAEVAIGAHGNPRTSTVDPDREREKAVTAAGIRDRAASEREAEVESANESKQRDMTSEKPKRRYMRRDMPSE